MNKMFFIFDKNKFLFQLNFEDQIRVSINIDMMDNEWKPRYTTFFKDYGILSVKLTDGIFQARYKKIPEELTKKLNNGYYELISQIKHHPKVRLLIINALEEEFRKVWEIA